MANTANITPTGYNFGQGGYASFHRIQLPGMGTIPNAASKDDPVANFRKGILFYFGHCELPDVGYDDVRQAWDGIKSKGKDVRDAIKEARSTQWGKDARVQSISEAVTDALQKYQGSGPAWLSDVSSQAAARIAQRIPDVIAGLLSEVGKMSVPLAGDLKNFGIALVSTVKKAHTYWSTRGLDDALRSGEPTVIVEALRRELGKDALAQLVKTIYDGAKAVANALTAGAASVVAKVIDTVAAFVFYIWKLYKKVRDYLALRKFFAECSEKFIANDSVIVNASRFRTWFSEWVAELPIIVSHCVASPICGSYFGFLSTLADGPTLKNAYGKFQSLKDPAGEFVKGYDLEFTSSDPMVKMSLRVIQKGGVDLTDGAAAQSLGWFRRTLMKHGSKVGLTKNTLYS